MLAELERVVRPGGIVVASEPDWGTLAIDATDREATRAAVRVLCDDHIRHGWIGRQLAGHFRRQTADRDRGPSGHARAEFASRRARRPRARHHGHADWLKDLDERDRGGAFFAAMSGFTVKGRVGP